MNYALTIAGFDPSGGAGLLADVKTFEQLNVYGLAATTSITLQTEDEFKRVSWVPLHQIELQIDTLLNRYPVKYTKIGLVQNFELLLELLQFLEKQYPQLRIIWDPILKATAGFQFHQYLNKDSITEILSHCFLITPNCAEAGVLADVNDAYDAGVLLSKHTNVFLKSSKNEKGFEGDFLFNDGEISFMESEIISGSEKHGSGCVLSSAITANLANGNDLKEACVKAKQYTLEFLKSSESKLGWHHHIKQQIVNA